jgi:predicted O-methyltransferase YrrM
MAIITEIIYCKKEPLKESQTEVYKARYRDTYFQDDPNKKYVLITTSTLGESGVEHVTQNIVLDEENAVVLIELLKKSFNIYFIDEEKSSLKPIFNIHLKHKNIVLEQENYK